MVFLLWNVGFTGVSYVLKPLLSYRESFLQILDRFQHHHVFRLFTCSSVWAKIKLLLSLFQS